MCRAADWLHQHAASAGSCRGPARPAYEFDKLPATATDGEIILALARDWGHGRNYEGQLGAVVAGCR